MKKDRRFIASICWIVIGAVLMGVSYAGLVDEYWSAMGTALFVVARVGNMKFKTLMKGVVPFLIPLIITLILLNIFPQITLLLPTLLTGGV